MSVTNFKNHNTEIGRKSCLQLAAKRGLLYGSLLSNMSLLNLHCELGFTLTL